MRPSADNFPLSGPSSPNSSNPVPIISVTTSRPSASPSSSSRSLPTFPTPDLPSSAPSSATPRPREDRHPANAVVLGCRNGQVRRMRSVLDMKLGAMAGSLPSFSTLPDVDDPKLKLGLPDPDENLNRRALSAKEPTDDGPVLDVFGIAIPKNESKDDQAAAEPFWNVHDALSVSSVSDGACSVVLAESPSRLDLSALLC